MILIGVLVGLLFAPSVSGRFALVLGVAIALVVVGALAELGVVAFPVVVFAPVVAGIVVYLGGVRADPLDIASLDAIFSVLWIVLLATAFRGFGDTPGLAVGLGAAASAGLFALAGFADQAFVATLAAALGGSCLGFLAYNLRPASLFPGKSGGMLVGFLLAVATIEVEVPISAPGHLTVPLILMAVPLLDVLMVACGRIHHGVPLAKHRGDHLTHRLTARGAQTDTAAGILIFVQFVMSVIAVFVGRGVLREPLGIAAALLMLAILLVLTVRQLVYTDATKVARAPVDRRRRGRPAVPGVGAGRPRRRPGAPDARRRPPGGRVRGGGGARRRAGRGRRALRRGRRQVRRRPEQVGLAARRTGTAGPGAVAEPPGRA